MSLRDSSRQSSAMRDSCYRADEAEDDGQQLGPVATSFASGKRMSMQRLARRLSVSTIASSALSGAAGVGPSLPAARSLPTPTPSVREAAAQGRAAFRAVVGVVDEDMLAA